MFTEHTVVKMIKCVLFALACACATKPEAVVALVNGNSQNGWYYNDNAL